MNQVEALELDILRGEIGQELKTKHEPEQPASNFDPAKPRRQTVTAGSHDTDYKRSDGQNVIGVPAHDMEIGGCPIEKVHAKQSKRGAGQAVKQHERIALFFLGTGVGNRRVRLRSCVHRIMYAVLRQTELLAIQIERVALGKSEGRNSETRRKCQWQKSKSAE